MYVYIYIYISNSVTHKNTHIKMSHITACNYKSEYFNNSVQKY